MEYFEANESKAGKIISSINFVNSCNICKINLLLNSSCTQCIESINSPELNNNSDISLFNINKMSTTFNTSYANSLKSNIDCVNNDDLKTICNSLKNNSSNNAFNDKKHSSISESSPNLIKDNLRNPQKSVLSILSKKRSSEDISPNRPSNKRPNSEPSCDKFSTLCEVYSFNNDNSIEIPKTNIKKNTTNNITRNSCSSTSNLNGFTPRELHDYYNLKGQPGLEREFALLRAESVTGSFEVSKFKSNASKNRYTDIFCLDETRVKLNKISSVINNHSDYIHANFVDGYKKKRAYISTQGPLTKTFAHFWQMIWEQNVLLIVMTTKVFEKGRMKCGQYWPLEENFIELYGNFAVINNGSTKVKDEIISTNLLLQNLVTIESREVTHIHFTGWPDFGVPSSAQNLLDLIFHVRHVQISNWEKGKSKIPNEPPIVIHCSAGIGRTGTFIALDILTQSLKDQGLVSPLKTIRKIRSQRALSVQMPDQYVFCYKALLEYAKTEYMLTTINKNDKLCDNDV